MLVFRDLYRYYSRLQLTIPEDRPSAIAALEKRLIKRLGVRGGCGIVDDGVFGYRLVEDGTTADGVFGDGSPGLLRRSLLWCRGSDEASLKRIFFPPQGQGPWGDGASPPSWSWMAYQGGIDYLEKPFDPIEWAYGDVISPWSGAAMGTWSSCGDSGAGRAGLEAVVREIKHDAWKEPHAEVIFDNPAVARGFKGLKCVILGRLQSQSHVQSRTHCVMLVAPFNSVPKGHRRGAWYERVGVGYLCSDLIELGEPGTLASIY